MKSIQRSLPMARACALAFSTIQLASCGSGGGSGNMPSNGALEPFAPSHGIDDGTPASQDTSANTMDQDTAANAAGAAASSTGADHSSEGVQPIGLVGAGGAASGGGPEMGMTPPAGATPSMAGASPMGVPLPDPLDVKFVGNISTRGQIRSDFPMYWDQFSPENEGKWVSVQPNEGTFNWAALDREYAFAQQNNIIFKEHNFIWGNQQPTWVNNDNAQAAVQTWMSEFCQRYPDVRVIDVVNEPPPHTTPKYIDGLGGTGASGYDWIANAFKMARQACPNAILLLNDYNNIELDGDNNHTIDIVTRIKAAGAPIDGVGAQSHGLANATSTNVKRRIDNIMTQAGVPVYITEFDLNIADDQKQMSVMQDLFTMFWNDPNVKGITLWGYIEGSTWETNTGLMTADGQMRPAMSWLMNFLGRP